MHNTSSLRSFNLNSLPILREVLRHGSVTKAAKSLNVSQPALSAALKQLRQHFGDELIVRSRGKMVLTPYGERLLAPLESTLDAVHALIDPDPAQSPGHKETQRIATTDHLMQVLGPPLVRLLMERAPHIRPHFLGVGKHSVEQLLSGAIDYIITPRAMMTTGLARPADFEQICTEPLFSERLLAIGRQDDAKALKGLSIGDYLARPHASFALDADLHISLEQAHLATNSLQQNDVIRLASYNSLFSVVAMTGCIALIPERLAPVAHALFGLFVFTPPIEFPPLDWTIVWHRRLDASPANADFIRLLKLCVVESSDPSMLASAA
jgi:DNA-binding transcriptional LysR family regulator